MQKKPSFLLVVILLRAGYGESQSTSTRGSCSSGLFDCGNGRCVSQSFVCDGDNDCRNFADETSCATTSSEIPTSPSPITTEVPRGTNCTDGEFDCLNGRCININRTCDGYNHCFNNVDETNCPFCKGLAVYCGNGLCIRSCKRCNGVYDCLDGSDEIGCPTEAPTTPPVTTEESGDCAGQFNCGNGRCTNLPWVCDGDNDCGNNADEQNCEQCKPSAFNCGNETCIRDFKICNGVDDCGNNLDEQNCQTPSPCSEGEFDCQNGRCLSLFWRCDGDDDCANNADETRCDSCRGDSFHCDQRLCIRNSRVCDGILDCLDGTDEQLCTPDISTTAATSTETCGEQFDCGNGRCTNIPWICDGDNDCGNNADERNCETCTRTAFYCGNGRCINSFRICNGIDDCGNLQDEQDCQSNVSPIETPEVICRKAYPQADPLIFRDESCQVLCRGNQIINGERRSFIRYHQKNDGLNCGFKQECIGSRCRESEDVAICRDVFNGRLSRVDNIGECSVTCVLSGTRKTVNKSDGRRCTFQGNLGSGVCMNGACIQPAGK